MKVTKAYIIKINTPLSDEYAKMTADSCDRVGLKWEYYFGHQYVNPPDLWENNPMVGSYYRRIKPGPASVTQTHFDLWKKILDEQDCAIILEHDAIMLHSLDLDIPDNMIVNLGYKLADYTKYNYEAASAPIKINTISKHAGAHAYAINYNTAKILLDELKQKGVKYPIDDFYFMRDPEGTSVNCGITNPICCLAWVRETTMMAAYKVPHKYNYMFINSFIENYSGKIRVLGEKFYAE